MDKAKEMLKAWWAFMEEDQTSELSAYTEGERDASFERFFAKHPEFKAPK